MNYAAITLLEKYLQAKPRYLSLSFTQCWNKNVQQFCMKQFLRLSLQMSESVLVCCLKQTLVLWQCLPSSSSEGNMGIVRVVALPGKGERAELCAARAPSKPLSPRITSVFHSLDNLQLKVPLPSSSHVEIVVLMPNSHCRATTVHVKGLQGVSGKRSVEQAFGFTSLELLFQAFCTLRLTSQQFMQLCTIQHPPAL